MTAFMAPWMYVSLAHAVILLGGWRLYWGCWLPRNSDFNEKCKTEKERRKKVLLYTATLALAATFPFLIYDGFRKPTEYEQSRAEWDSPEWQTLAGGVYKLPARRTKRAYRTVVEREQFPEILKRFIAKHPELEVVNVSAVMASDSNGAMYEEHYIVTTRPRQ